MEKTVLKLALISTLGLVAACGGNSSYSTFTREAGGLIGGGDFGNSTMHNTQVLSGERSYVHNLATRFASEVPSTINFAFNSAQIEPDAAQVLIRQADWIRQFPEVRFRVYGHTDAVGSDNYNYGLGKRRAEAVVRFLASRGINRSRLEAVVSKGETQPVIVTQDQERRNRRTVTEVTGFVREHPSVMDGKYGAIIYRDYVQSAVVTTTLTGIENSPTDGN